MMPPPLSSRKNSLHLLATFYATPSLFLSALLLRPAVWASPQGSCQPWFNVVPVSLPWVWQCDLGWSSMSGAVGFRNGGRRRLCWAVHVLSLSFPCCFLCQSSMVERSSPWVGSNSVGPRAFCSWKSFCVVLTNDDLLFDIPPVCYLRKKNEWRR